MNPDFCSSEVAIPDLEALSLSDPSPLSSSVSSISFVSVENPVHAQDSSSLGISRSGRRIKLNKRFTGEFGKGLKLILRRDS